MIKYHWQACGAPALMQDMLIGHTHVLACDITSRSSQATQPKILIVDDDPDYKPCYTISSKQRVMR